jgi:hypothetical protein
MYLPDTNILLTRFLAETSLVELIDFMTISEGWNLRAWCGWRT